MLRPRLLGLIVATSLTLGCAGGKEPLAPGPAALQILSGQSVLTTVLGQEIDIPVTLLDDRGSPMPMPPGLTIVSRNPAVVTMDGNRLLTHSMGTAMVVASVTSGGRFFADSLEVVVTCTLELIFGFTPQQRTLAVGESFTPTVTLLGCGGRALTETFHWTSSDTTIAAVDSLSGKVTALRPGQASVQFIGTHYGVHGTVQVTVTLPPQADRRAQADSLTYSVRKVNPRLS